MRLLVLTDREQSEAAGRSLPETVAAAVDAGAPEILFRERYLPIDERRALGEQVAAACGDARLLVAADAELAEELGAVGVHLPAGFDWPDTDLEVGRSCHSAEDVADAEAAGADFVTISPIFVTASKPGYGPLLGKDGLARIVAGTALPVIALGGITDATEVAACREAGAAAVAVMGGVMAADDPGAVVRDLLTEIEGGERP